MLVVLLVSDDPRTSWSFNWCEVWSSSRSYTVSRVRSNLIRASLHLKLQTRCSGETVRITRLEA
jgi:hypothetical protein